MVRYETYNYLDYEEYKYLEDKTNSEMYPSSNKREFDTLLRKNIRWYLDSAIKDDEKRIELFDKFINVNMNIDVRKTEFILNQVYKLLTFLKFINYSLTKEDVERLYKKNYIINVLMENMAILNYRKPGKRLDKAFKNSNFAMLWDKILESVDLDNLRIPKEQDSYYQYLNEVNYRKNLTLEEEQDLGYRILNGDKEAVNMLVKSNLKLVLQRVKKYAGSKIDTLDLIQEGNMGLMEAARRFDVTKGYRFSTYASWYIEAYIKRNLYKIMNVPYHTINLIIPYQSYVITYYNKYGVNPTDEEILFNTDLSMEDIKKVRKILERDNILEDIPIDIDYNALEKKELKEKLLKLKDKCDISVPEYKALCLRLGIGYREHTYIEIAKIMNTSKQRVQQLTNNAIIKLRLCQEIKEYAAYLDAPDAAVENIDKMQRNLVKQHKKIARKMGYDVPKKRGKHE